MVRKIDEQRELIMDNARTRISREVDYVDVKPFSHNIISLNLQHVGEKVGKDAANSLIDEFGLEEMGWRKEK